MSNEPLDDRSQSAARAARTWASNDAEIRSVEVLASVRHAAGRPPVSVGSNRRTPLLLGAAALAIGAVVGVAVLVDRGPADDVLVPVDTPAADSTVPEPTVVDGIVDTVADTQPSPPSSDRLPEPVVVEPDVPPAPRTFGVDFAANVQDAFPVAETVLGVGSGAIELGRDGALGPLVPTYDGSMFVVADPVNRRVQLVNWYAVELSREDPAGLEDFLPGLVPVNPLPIFADSGLDPADFRIGQPILGPNGDEILVPVVANPPASDASLTIERFVRGDDFSWSFEESIVPEPLVPESAAMSVGDSFVIEGRSLVNVPTGIVVDDFGPDAPFVPIVRERPDGWSVVDESGTETIWDVGSFDGDATGLADGSVVLAGAPADSSAADSDAILLRLWPDGASARSRYALGDADGVRRVTTDGASTISLNDEGDWLLQQWPLPGRVEEPPTQPDEDIGDCDSLYGAGEFAQAPANGYNFPWTVSGGPAGGNGAYVVVYDALGRVVVGGGCGSSSQPLERLDVQGADYTTYGDSIIVALAEPLSLGGVDDAPSWLGEPIAEGVIDSLASEIKVYRVPDDRELPQADEENTFLLVQIRGARLIRITSSGIGVYSTFDEPAPVDDPFDLRGRATPFVQGYLDALAEGRWDDAVIYIANDGRNWADRPAFADLYALVGEDVGTAAALERWCTQERDCTRGVVNGVLQQVEESQVEMAITFEVPGGGMFDSIINPLWTVGSYEGSLYVDGLPQVPR